MDTTAKSWQYFSSKIASPPPSIAWQNLRYEVRTYDQFKWPNKKPLLTRLNGSFECGTLSGLMGTSGAGKSTLLNCLSGSKTAGLTAESEIYVTASPEPPVAFFIEQHIHETIVGELTVRQTLQYAFRFKNSDSKALMEEHIAKTISALLLEEKLLEQRFDQCSGGEQKRIAIAQELMALRQPDFLLIDEPTTGLDSSAALEVVRCLSRLVKNSPKLTVIASIHVPSSEMLHYFDQVYVLARGGLCLYSGQPALLGSHLEKSGVKCSRQDEPPIESLIRIASADLTNRQLQCLATESLAAEFAKLQPHLLALTLLPSGLPHHRKAFHLTDLFTQLCRQGRVTFIAQRRQLLAQILLLAGTLLFSTTFFDSKMVLPNGCHPLSGRTLSSNCTSDLLVNFQLRENINYIGLSRLLQQFFVISMSTTIYSSVVKIFRNEYRNRWYSLSVFFWATNLVFLLQITLIALVLALIAYFAVGEHAIDDYRINMARLGHYILCMTICQIFTQSLGQLVGALLLGSFVVAMGCSVTLLAIVAMFDDFFFKTAELNSQIILWVSELMNLKFIHRYLMVIFYGLDRCDDKTETSWVLAENYANVGLIGVYIGRVLAAALALKLLTLALLYVRFNWDSVRRTVARMSSEPSSQPLAIEWPNTTAVALCQEKPSETIMRPKTDQELLFERFSKHKISIAWRNLTLLKARPLFSLQTASANSEPILCNLNGQLNFGTLAALMGMSGAGKTSLLRVLNSQCQSRLTSSTEFYLSRFTPITTAYVAQEVSDHLLRGLTARQSLVYASKLKNSFHRGVDHKKIAQSLLEVLLLVDASETKVENCSGGERKRLALALELTSLQMPNLICIDEPISGLDSSSAVTVISTLRNLAHHHNLTILTSVHQPNTELLLMFDQLYVLARGGVCIYSGPPSQIGAHLQQVIAFEADVNHFPIETLIKHSCLGIEDATIQQLVAAVDKHVPQLNLSLKTEAQLAPGGVLPNRARFSLHSVYLLTLRYLAHIRGYLWKEWLLYTALYLLYGLSLRLFIDPQVATAAGCFSLESDDLSALCSKTTDNFTEEKLMIGNILYTVFICAILLAIVIMQSGLTLLRECPHFLNEHRNGWYSSGSWYAMKLLFDTLPMLPIFIVYVAIVQIYEPVRSGYYWYFVLLVQLGVSASQAQAYVTVLLCNLNLLLSIMAAVGIIITAVLTSNLFVNVRNMHYFQQLLSFLSVPRFGMEALFVLQYGFSRCRANEIQLLLYWMALTDEDYLLGVAMLITIAITFRVVGLWLLVKKANPRMILAKEETVKKDANV